MTTEVLKQALEALEMIEEYGAPTLLSGVKVRDSAAALRTAISQPDCRGCELIFVRGDGCHQPDCTNGDKFQALPKVVLYKVTK